MNKEINFKYGISGIFGVDNVIRKFIDKDNKVTTIERAIFKEQTNELALKNEDIYNEKNEVVEYGKEIDYNSQFLIKLSLCKILDVKKYLDFHLKYSINKSDFIDYVKYGALYSEIISSKAKKEIINEWLEIPKVIEPRLTLEEELNELKTGFGTNDFKSFNPYEWYEKRLKELELKKDLQGNIFESLLFDLRSLANGLVRFNKLLSNCKNSSQLFKIKYKKELIIKSIDRINYSGVIKHNLIDNNNYKAIKIRDYTLLMFDDIINLFELENVYLDKSIFSLKINQVKKELNNSIDFKELEILKEQSPSLINLTAKKNNDNLIKESAIVPKPYLKEEIAETVFEFLKDFFETEQQQEFKRVLISFDKAKEKLLFKSNGNQLSDAFKKLIENHFIVGFQKKDLNEWILTNFQFFHRGDVKDFKIKTIEQIISGKQTPCKNPIIKIINNQIVKIDK